MRAKLRSAAHSLFRLLVQLYFDKDALDKPVFIIGCGRSGTTILGELLASHTAIAYLHEPREIWSIEPRTDIWSAEASKRRGSLRLGADDVRPETAARIARAFAAEVHIRGARRLVEKLPINSFRVSFVDRMFPDALFIHLIRDGLQVARSIGRLADRGAWFGDDQYKWKLLVAESEAAGLGRLVELSSTNELRALLEWRLSVAAARAALACLADHRWLELRYERLISDPQATCMRLEAFLGLPPDPAMRGFARTQITRCTPVPYSASGAARLIAGDLLAEFGYLDVPTPKLQA
jgi:LPS sulfotransferase NodH